MTYTDEQLKAAYALNLCTVSVSQIIDYNDINVMEQEYEAVLNNINLEQMPKDEALLKVLKQILDTITFFRIQEKEKALIEKEYQQELKDAIWSAVPNFGVILAGGDWASAAINLAAQVGIGYMNYRKNKASMKLRHERQKWALEESAMEQFNGLRRELFDTAWRLAAAYNFPDELRLTERQIKQYNAILQDGDIVRRYDRLSDIRDRFEAYPPFWYQMGNTANAIARSDLPLSDGTREKYRIEAKDHFLHFNRSNKFPLLREDPIAASCALEYIELLDSNSEIDRREISIQLEKAIRYSGRANDVLQLAAFDYLKINEKQKATGLFRTLVNEQYNTAMNAQILSGLYVYKYLQGDRVFAKPNYETLASRVGRDYLYPMPETTDQSFDELEQTFLQKQRMILAAKYNLTFKSFIRKYTEKYWKLFPSLEVSEMTDEGIYQETDECQSIRHDAIVRLFKNSQKRDDYLYRLNNVGISYRILDVLNDMVKALCELDVMSEPIQTELSDRIRKAIIDNKELLNSVQTKLTERRLDENDLHKLYDLCFSDLTETFFEELYEETARYIVARKEMQDFAIAEQNLTRFCMMEGLPDPTVAYGKDGRDSHAIIVPEERFFTIDLLGKEGEVANKKFTITKIMADLIKHAKPQIIHNAEKIDLYLADDPEIERYFNSVRCVRSDNHLKSHTIAILDDKRQVGDCDLVFTTSGIVPIRNKVRKTEIAYKDVQLTAVPYPTLNIDGKYSSREIDVNQLFKLIGKLKEHAKPVHVSKSESSFHINIFGIKI